MESNFEVDFKEMENQRRDAMLKSEKYTLMEIVVGEDFKEPTVHFEANDVSYYSLGKLYKTLEVELSILERKFPLIKKASKQFEAGRITEIDKDGKVKKINNKTNGGN